VVIQQLSTGSLDQLLLYIHHHFLACSIPSQSVLSHWIEILLSQIDGVGVGGTKVAYNDRALVIAGERRIIISGSIHYPRSTPEVRSRSNQSACG
jgi:hypothetical protein